MSRRRASRVRREAPPPRLKLATVAEMRVVRDRLQMASRREATLAEKALAVQCALEYRNAYFKTGKGTLRRVFPKAGAVIAFNTNEAPDTEQQPAEAESEGNDAPTESKADFLPDQQ